jgi:hypothetical protein
MDEVAITTWTPLLLLITAERINHRDGTKAKPGQNNEGLAGGEVGMGKGWYIRGGGVKDWGMTMGIGKGVVWLREESGEGKIQKWGERGKIR